MLIIGTEGYLPVQKKTARPAGAFSGGQAGRTGARYDSCSLSGAAEDQGRSFLEAVSALSSQVRTANTTGKIQELRSQVLSGQYRISPREVAARMLLMEEGE